MLLKTFRHSPWILPTLIFTILVILAANMHPLWGDEAETALFGRNILQYGLPYGWDGVNIMGIDNAAVLNKDLINHTSPWGQYYLIALSFLIFGESSFTARLPFILLSILSIPVLYFLALKLSQSKRVAFITVLILSLSVPFILFAYQARYYGLVTFASALFLLSSLQLIQKSFWPKLLFILSGTLFFYGNYVSFLVFYIATIITLVIYNFKHQSKTEFKRFIYLIFSLSMVIALFCLPWYVWMKPQQGRLIGLMPADLFTRILQEVVSVFWPYNQNNGFPILFLVVFAGILINKIIKKQSLGGLFIPSLIPVIFFSILMILTILIYTNTFLDDMRYTMVTFPLLTIVLAQLLNEIWKWRRKIAVLVLILLLTTNVFTLLKPRIFLLKFVKEALNPYPSPDFEVAKYLKQHAKEGETAFINIDRSHEPLIFHLGKKIKFVNRILPNNTILSDNADIIPEYIYRFYFEPDWVIMYGKHDSLSKNFYTFDLRTTFPLGLHPKVDLKNHYTEAILPIYFADMSRPEIHRRSFIRLNPSYNQQIFIYEKK